MRHLHHLFAVIVLAAAGIVGSVAAEINDPPPVDARIGSCSTWSLGTTGGASYCGFSWSGYRLQRVVVSCTTPAGGYAIRNGQWRTEYQTSAVYCPAGWYRIDRWINYSY